MNRLKNMRKGRETPREHAEGESPELNDCGAGTSGPWSHVKPNYNRRRAGMTRKPRYARSRAMLVCKSFAASEGRYGAAGTAFPDGESGCGASSFTGYRPYGSVYLQHEDSSSRSAREGRTKPMRGEPSVRALRTWQANRGSGPAPKARSRGPCVTGGGVEKTRTFDFSKL